MKILILITIFLISTNSFAIVHPVEMALTLPLKNRNEVLSNLGKGSFNELKAIASDKKKDMNLRWRAIVSLGMLYPLDAKSDLGTWVHSKKWFVRNASVIALSHGDHNFLISKLKVLINDPSLVVRTSVVQVIDKLKLTSLKPILWKKLYAKENYRKNESLWIRKHIVRALSHMAHKREAQKFIRVLTDKDESLLPYALKALNRAVSRRVALKKDPVHLQKQKWQEWWLRSSPPVISTQM